MARAFPAGTDPTRGSQAQPGIEPEGSSRRKDGYEKERMVYSDPKIPVFHAFSSMFLVLRLYQAINTK